jgi:hypothetical protein
MDEIFLLMVVLLKPSLNKYLINNSMSSDFVFLNEELLSSVSHFKNINKSD